MPAGLERYRGYEAFRMKGKKCVVAWAVEAVLVGFIYGSVHSTLCVPSYRAILQVRVHTELVEMNGSKGLHVLGNVKLLL